MEISSTNNNFIKQILKEKAKNRFLLFLDTPNLIKEAFSNNLKLKHIFLETNKSFDFILPEHKDKTTYVSLQVLKKLSEVKSPAGIVAVFEISKKPYKQPQTNFLVLDNVQEPGNVGTLLRSAQATNFKTVFLLDCAAVTNPKTVRASAGAIFKLDIFEMSKQEFLQNINTKKLFLAVLNGKNVFETKFENNIGLVLGNEAKGISQDFLNLKNTQKITLPMKNELESLNVAISGSVIMYHISNK